MLEASNLLREFWNHSWSRLHCRELDCHGCTFPPLQGGEGLRDLIYFAGGLVFVECCPSAFVASIVCFSFLSSF